MLLGVASAHRARHPFLAISKLHSKKPEASDNCANLSLGKEDGTVHVSPSHCSDVRNEPCVTRVAGNTQLKP